MYCRPLIWAALVVPAFAQPVGDEMLGSELLVCTERGPQVAVVVEVLGLAERVDRATLGLAEAQIVLLACRPVGAEGGDEICVRRDVLEPVEPVGQCRWGVGPAVRSK